MIFFVQAFKIKGQYWTTRSNARWMIPTQAVRLFKSTVMGCKERHPNRKSPPALVILSKTLFYPLNLLSPFSFIKVYTCKFYDAKKKQWFFSSTQAFFYIV